MTRKYKDEIYRVYITDALKIIAENTAKFAGGSHLTKRYVEMIGIIKPEPKKTAEQIIDEVTKKAGLEVR